jgi:hypothetical protein
VRKTLTAVIVLVTASSWLYLFDRASSNGEAAVRRAEQTWGEAIVAKSLDQTIAFYAPDAVTAGSAMFPARGRRSFGPHGPTFLRMLRTPLHGKRSASLSRNQGRSHTRAELGPRGQIMAPILPCGRNSKTANGKSLSTRPGQSIRPEESSDRGIYRVTRVAFMSNDGKTHEGLLLLLEGLLFQKLQQTKRADIR